MNPFEHFFNPRSIAVIGASQDLASISGQPIAHLKTKGYAGEVYPVNPRYEEVAGYRCYADVAALPQAPDVAVIAVGAKRVPEALRELGAKGGKFAVILSSGFAEAGEEGARAQREITAIGKSFGMQVIGPNCQGYMNISDAIHVGFGAPYGATIRRAASASPRRAAPSATRSSCWPAPTASACATTYRPATNR